MKKKNIKKIISIFSAIIICLTFSVTSSAYDFVDDVRTDFLFDYGGLYLTEETKAGDIRYFGDRITITTEDGVPLDADDYISTGDKLAYFGILDNYTIVVMGDTDCDGHITAADARLVLRMSAGLYNNVKYSEKPDMKGAFDTNNSGLIEASDARDILRVSAKLDDFSDFEEAVKKKYANEKESDYDDEMIMVCLNPAYVNNEDIYKPEFYGDLVGNVEKWIEYSEDHIWINLFLKEPSKKNVDKLVEECHKNDAVIIAEKNYIFYLDTLD